MRRWLLTLCCSLSAFGVGSAEQIPAPVYPQLARSAKVTGVVSVLVHVGADGWLHIETKSGHPLLTRSVVAGLAQVRLSHAPF